MAELPVARPHTAAITVNGDARALVIGATVTDLVQAVTGRRIAVNGQAADGNRLGVAVALNAEVVPRSQGPLRPSSPATTSKLSPRRREVDQ